MQRQILTLNIPHSLGSIRITLFYLYYRTWKKHNTSINFFSSYVHFFEDYFLLLLDNIIILTLDLVLLLISNDVVKTLLWESILNLILVAPEHDFFVSSLTLLIFPILLLHLQVYYKQIYLLRVHKPLC